MDKYLVNKQLGGGSFISTHIMKREFEQWWSTIPPISTKQTNHKTSGK
jgi:hypothetical protein